MIIANKMKFRSSKILVANWKCASALLYVAKFRVYETYQLGATFHDENEH